jgi:hypothetical protein
MNKNIRVLKRNFNDLQDDELNAKLLEIYIEPYIKKADVLELHVVFLTDYPGLPCLRELARSGFSDQSLAEYRFEDGDRLSPGIQRMIVLPLMEQEIFGRSL